MSNLLSCPICGDELKIHGPEDWKPTRYDPDSGGDPYSASCDCGFHYSNGSYDYSEFIICLNRRAQPSEKPAPLEAAPTIRAEAPLTLEELRGMDGEPVWCEYRGPVCVGKPWGVIGEWMLVNGGILHGNKGQVVLGRIGVDANAYRSKPKEEV